MSFPVQDITYPAWFMDLNFVFDFMMNHFAFVEIMLGIGSLGNKHSNNDSNN